MAPLIDCFQLQEREVISIIGSGGKTSLMRYLARQIAITESILLSTTTKMGYPLPSDYDYFYQDHFEQMGREKNGITMAGKVIKNGELTKMQMPAEASFIQSFSKFKKVILEADGSKQLPLKGWADFEPVILSQTTTTIGIVPITVIGQSTTEKTIHRLPFYLKMVAVKIGEPILPQHLAEVICSPKGMFRKARGRKIVYFSQVNNSERLAIAQRVVTELTREQKEALDLIIAGDVFTNEGVILWKK